MPADGAAADRHARLRKLFPTRNKVFRELLGNVEKVLDHDVNVLILGEHGVGKDSLAEAIHVCGPRGSAPFVSIDCASLPHEIFESELFGHERGAFTDAQTQKIGRVEMARGGTLYFDRVASLPSSLQAKLLRLIQDRKFSRLGSNRILDLDARVISSAGSTLEDSLTGTGFRKDLYYRLNVFTIELPPLRKRREDVPRLAELFLRNAIRGSGRSRKTISDAAMALLEDHSWPGNLRELRNVIERAALLEEGPEITPESLPVERFVAASDLLGAAADGAWPLEELEKRYIREILRQTGQNYSKAAEILGINRKTLLEKRKRYGL